MKLRNKLILSCAALAAVATTAFSTTFAWYTSNEVVSVGTITANTQNSGADLLMIADGQKLNTTSGNVEDVAVGELKWGTRIDSITVSGTTVESTFKPTELTPLAYNGTVAAAGAADTTGGALVGYATKYVAATGKYVAGTKYYTTNTGAAEVDTKDFVAGTTDVSDYFVKKLGTSTSTDDGSGYLQFVLFLKNAGTEAKNIRFRITSLTNETAATALPRKSIVDPTNNATFIGLQPTAVNYAVNALRVAALDVEVKTYTATGVASGLSDETCYGLSTAIASPSYGDDAASVPANGAHNYFNAIMDTPLDLADTKNVNTADFKSLGGASGTYLTDATVSGTTATANVKLPSAASADTGFQVKFKLFLNGWDKACFDACQGQTLSFGLEFTTKDSF